MSSRYTTAFQINNFSQVQEQKQVATSAMEKARSAELDRQSNTSNNFEVKRSFAYKTIQYLLGHVNSNWLQMKKDNSNAATRNETFNPFSQKSSNDKNVLTADNLLFESNLAGDFKTQEEEELVQSVKRRRLMSDGIESHVIIQKSQFHQSEQIVNQYDIKSTLSSEDEKSENQEVQGHEVNYEKIQKILSTESIGKATHGKQRILVESVFNGLLGEQTTIFQIPCLISADESTFFVYLNQMDSEKFNKTALFNLVDTAEKSSNKCKKVVFILAKQNNSKFAEMEKIFSVIDAERMPINEMKDVISPSEFLQVQRDFGLFELEL